MPATHFPSDHELIGAWRFTSKLSTFVLVLPDENDRVTPYECTKRILDVDGKSPILFYKGENESKALSREDPL
jgi:hypothetical protein